MKPGTKLKSVVCDTEVMVIRATATTHVECGGAPMVNERAADERPAQLASLDPTSAAGTKIGKRYVDAAGSIELLCVKAGQGSLTMAGEILKIKDAKPLPASD